MGPPMRKELSDFGGPMVEHGGNAEAGAASLGTDRVQDVRAGVCGELDGEAADTAAGSSDQDAPAEDRAGCT